MNRRTGVATLAVLVAVAVLAGVGAGAPGTTPTPNGSTPDGTDPAGEFRVLVNYPDGSGDYVNETVLTAEDLASVGGVERRRGGSGYYVPVRLTDAAAAEFADTLVERGFADGAQCEWGGNRTEGRRCLLLVDGDGEVLFAAGMNPELGRSMASGEFEKHPRFVFTAANESRAAEIYRAIAGRPVPNTTTPGGTTATATATTATTDAAPSTGTVAPGNASEAGNASGAGNGSPAGDGNSDGENGNGSPAGDGNSDGGGLDGFGAGVAALALAVAVLVRRRRSR